MIKNYHKSYIQITKNQSRETKLKKKVFHKYEKLEKGNFSLPNYKGQILKFKRLKTYLMLKITLCMLCNRNCKSDIILYTMLMLRLNANCKI